MYYVQNLEGCIGYTSGVSWLAPLLLRSPAATPHTGTACIGGCIRVSDNTQDALSLDKKRSLYS